MNICKYKKIYNINYSHKGGLNKVNITLPVIDFGFEAEFNKNLNYLLKNSDRNNLDDLIVSLNILDIKRIENNLNIDEIEKINYRNIIKFIWSKIKNFNIDEVKTDFENFKDFLNVNFELISKLLFIKHKIFKKGIQNFSISYNKFYEIETIRNKLYYFYKDIYTHFHDFINYKNNFKGEDFFKLYIFGLEYGFFYKKIKLIGIIKIGFEIFLKFKELQNDKYFNKIDLNLLSIFIKYDFKKNILNQTIPNQTIPDQTIRDQIIPEQTITDKEIADQTIRDQIIPEQTITDKEIADLKKKINEFILNNKENYLLQKLKEKEQLIDKRNFYTANNLFFDDIQVNYLNDILEKFTFKDLNEINTNFLFKIINNLIKKYNINNESENFLKLLKYFNQIEFSPENLKRLNKFYLNIIFYNYNNQINNDIDSMDIEILAKNIYYYINGLKLNIISNEYINQSNPITNINKNNESYKIFNKLIERLINEYINQSNPTTNINSRNIYNQIDLEEIYNQIDLKEIYILKNLNSESSKIYEKLIELNRKRFSDIVIFFEYIDYGSKYDDIYFLINNGIYYVPAPILGQSNGQPQIQSNKSNFTKFCIKIFNNKLKQDNQIKFDINLLLKIFDKIKDHFSTFIKYLIDNGILISFKNNLNLLLKNLLQKINYDNIDKLLLLIQNLNVLDKNYISLKNKNKLKNFLDCVWYNHVNVNLLQHEKYDIKLYKSAIKLHILNRNDIKYFELGMEIFYNNISSSNNKQKKKIKDQILKTLKLFDLPELIKFLNIFTNLENMDDWHMNILFIIYQAVVEIANRKNLQLRFIDFSKFLNKISHLKKKDDLNIMILIIFINLIFDFENYYKKILINDYNINDIMEVKPEKTPIQKIVVTEENKVLKNNFEYLKPNFLPNKLDILMLVATLSRMDIERINCEENLLKLLITGINYYLNEFEDHEIVDILNGIFKMDLIEKIPSIYPSNTLFIKKENVISIIKKYLEVVEFSRISRYPLILYIICQLNLWDVYIINKLLFPLHNNENFDKLNNNQYHQLAMAITLIYFFFESRNEIEENLNEINKKLKSKIIDNNIQNKTFVQRKISTIIGHIIKKQEFIKKDELTDGAYDCITIDICIIKKIKDREPFKIAIEINNQNHYIYKYEKLENIKEKEGESDINFVQTFDKILLMYDNPLHLNLKSRSKKKILEKMGYYYIDIPFTVFPKFNDDGRKYGKEIDEEKKYNKKFLEFFVEKINQLNVEDEDGIYKKELLDAINIINTGKEENKKSTKYKGPKNKSHSSYKEK